ncbi:hypothetical protein CB1_000976028 [Camelus ferus]|nr:hypothetical protein CB1_000976028 [Camelus ferus]
MVYTTVHVTELQEETAPERPPLLLLAATAWAHVGSEASGTDKKLWVPTGHGETSQVSCGCAKDVGLCPKVYTPGVRKSSGPLSPRSAHLPQHPAPDRVGACATKWAPRELHPYDRGALPRLAPDTKTIKDNAWRRVERGSLQAPHPGPGNWGL